METSLDKIRTYYASFDEWGRLEAPEGARELAHASEIIATCGHALLVASKSA